MWMMLRVIPIMWRAVRPSKVVDMPAVVNTFWLRKGYEGLTFFGHILAPTQELADAFNAKPNALKNHEMIHLRQAQSCGDSWLRFYILYIWYWLRTVCFGGFAIRRPEEPRDDPSASGTVLRRLLAPLLPFIYMVLAEGTSDEP